ncbi:hypothetical protein GCM10027169_22850 [Gordonia jinhuaensis]|uniref:Sensory transduction regulator n=1 Tax=Gordonia jinhuaensis TaxID=1517702 RepID=A0A916TDQ4_9ACTN|nr:hypothetical protein [Gordonia jinhuaensis]GGB41431.1 hypothetical protein GCM10011489_31300 [Gordonia jinhuaensis]
MGEASRVDLGGDHGPERDEPAEVLMARLGRLLSEVAVVDSMSDGAIMVDFRGTRAIVRSLTLADGLDVLSLTQVVAWDLPNTDALRDDIERLGSELNFGALKRSSAADVTCDVLLHYTFPGGNLTDLALLTLVHMVLASGVDLHEARTG